MMMNTDCEVVFFVSSSGHCTLDCPYCIIDPIAKHELSLNCGDIDFLLDTFQKKAFIAFSGKGDFFAGYRKSDQLLKAVLEREVEIALDINGVFIHDFPELSPHQLDKIRFMNLTMHYQQLREKNLLRVWAENARVLVEKKGEQMLLGTIVSPLLTDCWEDAFLFYEREIFGETGKQVVLVKDINRTFSEADENKLLALRDRFSDSVERIHHEDFAGMFEGCNRVFCPAGKGYFRIWNTGDIQGCPNIPELAHCGNVKKREVFVRDTPFCCSEMFYCDCAIIEGLGKMGRE